MHSSKIATCLAVLSFVCIVFVKYSQVVGGEISGPLVKAFYNVLTFWKEIPESTPTYIHQTYSHIKPLGFFDFFESELRSFVNFISIVLSLLSGIFAISASKHESNSFWYAIAIIISVTSLSALSYLSAVAFGLVCLVFIMNNRKWKLSRA